MLKVVVRALRSLVGDETAIVHSLFKHRNRANLHVLCPELNNELPHCRVRTGEAVGHADIG